MNKQITSSIFEELLSTLDIPESAYERVERRYRDLESWLKRDAAKCRPHGPQVSPQGSFRLGTVIRPLNDKDEYDLDLGCRLTRGVSKDSHTQEQLKHLVGDDLEMYRSARGIQNDLEEKHRCWRLRYEDELHFHMDAVPSIPEDEHRKQLLVESMIRGGSGQDLANDVSRFAGAITDNRLPNYSKIDHNWKISNSEGYARWFESRMMVARVLLEERARASGTEFSKLKAHKWKSPLQQAIQLLKRHRDVMFADHPDSKPISVIITTLSAQAYQGERDLASALERILADMEHHVGAAYPRVPNPVNPVEDFADKWSDPEYRHLRLEQNFKFWLQQARIDFGQFSRSVDAEYLAEQAHEKFAATLNAAKLKDKLGVATVGIITSPKSHRVDENPPRPWATF